MLYTLWQTTDIVRETAAAVQKDINKTNLWFVTTRQVSSRLTDGGQIIGTTLFGPTLQQTDLSADRMVFGPIHVF